MDSPRRNLYEEATYACLNYGDDPNDPSFEFKVQEMEIALERMYEAEEATGNRPFTFTIPPPKEDIFLTRSEMRMLKRCARQLFNVWQDDKLDELFENEGDLVQAGRDVIDLFMDDYNDGHLPLHDHYDAYTVDVLQKFKEKGKYPLSGLVQEIAYAMANVAQEKIIYRDNQNQDAGANSEDEEMSEEAKICEKRILDGYSYWERRDMDFFSNQG